MDMETKEILPDAITDCSEDFEFDQENIYCFYVKIDECERAYQVIRHRIGTRIEEDQVLYEEMDEMFYLTMTKSCDKRYGIGR